MASFNKITIVGHLGRDPEIRYTPQGQAVCNFSIATTERRKDNTGEMQDITTWFRVTFWGRQAEVANQYLSKGRQVYVEGRLRQSEFTDREGLKRFSLEVFGTDLHFLGTRGEEGSREAQSGAGGAGPGSSKPQAADEGDFSGPSDSDIPF